jgi:uncharacterized protein
VTDASKFTNRLARETSPYLLQHAHNPVDWYPWGEEAFAKARAEDKPILLSVGYATCHWCHVMERESFEDEAIARLLAGFVAIKVDREELPDVDHVYMSALQAMGARRLADEHVPDAGAGALLRRHLLPAGRAMACRLRRPAAAVAEAWRDRRAEIEQQAQALLAHVREGLAPRRARPAADPARAGGSATAEQLRRAGTAASAAPKFPQPPLLQYLLALAALGDDAPAPC